MPSSGVTASRTVAEARHLATRGVRARAEIPGYQRARGLGAGVVESFDIAAGDEAGELGLARGAAPGLGKEGCGDDEYRAADEQCPVPRPHAAFAAFSGDQGAGV